MMLNKKFSKVLCAVLAFAMIVTMLPAMALVASADEAVAENAGLNKLAFSDIAGSPYQREIGVLNAISVLAGDPEGTFRPGDSISRAEMAAIIVRIYGMESSVVPSATNFEDVPSNHWASGYVNIASGLGVINGDGDGKFRPDDKVKYNEAVKMLVCVLGYGLHAQEAGGWPAGYLVQATTLGVDEDVINQSGEASRETVAKLVFNTLDIDYLEKVGYGTDEQWQAVEGRTLLSEKMKVTKLEDIVSETYTTSLFGEGELKEGQVRIGTTRLLLGNSDISKYVGYPVLAYAKLDPKVDKTLSTLVYYEIMEEDVVFIEATPDDVASAAEGSITLFEDFENSAKTVKYTTSKDTYIFENGVGNMDFDLSTLYADGKANFQGKLIIIDVDDDQVIDSMFVEDTETIVVRSISKSSTGFYIRGKHTNERFPTKGNINLSDDAVKVSITKDGKAIDYTDLEEYDVLTYTKNGNIYNFTVCNETVDGAIEQITSEDEIVIDGVAYEKSPYFIDKLNKDLADEPSVGDTVEMYLDSYGQIAYVEVTVTSGADTYAYVIGMEKEEGFEGEDTYNLILLTTDNEKVSIPLASKVTLKKNVYAFDVEGSTITSTNLEVETIENRVTYATVDDLKQFGVFDTAGKPIKQLIKYSVTDEKISEIETALNIVPFATSGTIAVDTINDGVHSVVNVDAASNKSAIDKINTNIYKMTPNNYDGEVEVFTRTVMMNGTSLFDGKTCKKGNGYFSLGNSPSGVDSKYSWEGANLLFLPNEGGALINSDIEFFTSDKFFSIYHSYTAFNATDFEMYDCSKKGEAGVIVVKPDISTGTVVTVNPRSTHMLITKVGVGTDEDGESIIRIVGQSTPYSTNSCSEVTLSVPVDTPIQLRGKSGLTAKDLGVGDIINYTMLPNGKVYTANLMFSLKKDTAPFIYGHGGVSLDEFVSEAGQQQTVLYGNIAQSIEDDGDTSIRITTAAPGSSIEIGDSTMTGEYNPAGFTNYWTYDVNKKTLKKIEFADVPIPEELDETTLDFDNLPANTYQITDTNGNTFYAKCPRVLVHIHKSESIWRNINFIYFDDGSFDY